MLWKIEERVGNIYKIIKIFLNFVRKCKSNIFYEINIFIVSNKYCEYEIE